MVTNIFEKVKPNQVLFISSKYIDLKKLLKKSHIKKEKQKKTFI